MLSQVLNVKLFEGYDGDGQQLAETMEVTPLGGTPTQSSTYKLRSSLLGGQIVAELSSTGTKVTGYVYANGQLIARQQFGSVTWTHFSPTNLSERWTNTSGQMTGASEYDPAHSAVGTEDPGPGPDGTPPDLLYPRNGDPTDLSGGCTIDGAVAPCSVAMSLVNMGAGVETDPYDVGSGVTPILWTKGPQFGQTGFAVFHAYADGFSDFIPTTGRYMGGGKIETWVPNKDLDGRWTDVGGVRTISVNSIPGHWVRAGQQGKNQAVGCFERLAQIFGDPGAAGGEHGVAPGASNSNPIGAGKAHVYPSANGSGKTNIYVPAGYDSGVFVGGSNSTAYFYYGKNPLFGQTDVTLLGQHVTNAPDLNKARANPENGRVRIGTTGGLDGGQANGPNYQHAHIEVFHGKGLPDLLPNKGESEQTNRNAARIPYREIFCR